MKKIIKKILPHESIIDHFGDSHLANKLRSSRCLQINLRSISRGVAIGLFFAFLPLPLQMILAALTAAYFRGNILIAAAMTWITNPFTFIPINYFIFSVGHLITSNEESFHDIPAFTFANLSNGHLIDAIMAWLNQAGTSFLIGLPIVAFSVACLGYILVQITWRGYVSFRLYTKRRWRNQG